MSTRNINVNPAELLANLRQLVFNLKFTEAEELCDACLASHGEFRDAYGHPAFLKEKFRLALLQNQREAASELADRLRAALRPGDPAISVLLARFYARMGDRESAKREWLRVLEIAPSHTEAALGLKSAAVPSLIINGVTLVPL